jgi:DNA-binding NarL/FixJ family response regulator
MVRRGLRHLLGLQPGFLVCGEAQTQRQAYSQILRLRPNLAILDLRLKRGDGLALISQLRSRCPRLKILVFSRHGEQTLVDQALAAGADAFVSKEEGGAKTLTTLRRLAAKGNPKSEWVCSKRRF